MARLVNPDGPGTTGTGKPKKPVRFPKASTTKEGFLRPFATETYRRAYKPTQVQNERSGAKPVVKAANKERELQRIAARQQLQGNPFATVNSAKKSYAKRAERRSVTGPKTDKAVGTRQRGFYNDTMDTSLNPLGGGKRPTNNRYLNTWVSPDTLAPKRPTQISVKTTVYSGGKHGGNVTAGVTMPNKGIKQDKSGTYTVKDKFTLYGPNAQKNSLPFKGKKGAASSGTRKIGR
jgi:hypothetical protein